MTLEERISALAAAIGADIKLLGGASPDINAIDNLTGTGLIERTGDGTAALVTITAAGKALLDDPNTATQRATLGLGNVDNTADADKPVSTATQAALSGKADKATTLSGYGITDAAPSSHVGSGGSSHASATTATAGFMSATDKTKLDGIAAGAQVNTVTSVAGKTGAVTLAKGDVGLGNVDNTSDAAKPISTATQTALDAKVSASLVGSANGIAPLDATGKVASTYLPSYVDDVLEYTNLAGFPGTGETGKIYTALDSNKIYRWSGSVYVEISASPGSTDAVTEGSSNLYFTGSRVLATLLAGLSTATNATIVATDSVLSALGKLQKQITDNLATLTGHTGNTSNPHGTTKAQVGLGNVDNTSDASKPISTATQTALNTKAGTDGTGATGTWSISINGNAATAGSCLRAVSSGSYGSAEVYGSANGWSGVRFNAPNSVFMVRDADSYSGIYKNNNAWVWAFDQNGSLATGTVPWGSVSGRPTALSSFANDSGFITSSSNISGNSSKVSGDSAAVLSTYALPNTGGSSQWIYLGTWSGVPQSGCKVNIDLSIASGYNAAISQNGVYKIYFKTSNGSSTQSGSAGVYYADGIVWRQGPNSVIANLRVVQNDWNSYSFYAYCGAFTGSNSIYAVTVGAGTWANSSTLASPSGNFVDLPIYQIIDSSLVGVANGVAPLDSTGKVPAANLPSASGVTNGKAFFFKS